LSATADRRGCDDIPIPFLVVESISPAGM
jgi:hypothetical protein